MQPTLAATAAAEDDDDDETAGLMLAGLVKAIDTVGSAGVAAAVADGEVWGETCLCMVGHAKWWEC